MIKSLYPTPKDNYRTLNRIGMILIGIYLCVHSLSAQAPVEDLSRNRYYIEGKPVDFEEYESFFLKTLDTFSHDSKLEIKDGIYYYRLEINSPEKQKRLRKMHALKMPPDFNKTERMVAQIGKPFPDFKMKDIHGNVHHFKDFKGKVLVLNFWTTGCLPCIKEFPDLQKIAQSFKKRKAPVEFLAITYETAFTIKQFFESRQIELSYHKIANARTFWDHFTSVGGAPVNMIIDAQGNIFTYLLGGIEPKMFKKCIADALAGKDSYTHGRAGFTIEQQNQTDPGPVSPEAYKSLQQ